MSAPSFATGSCAPSVAPIRSSRAPSGLRILLVDDHVESIEPLTRLLQMCGHEVRAAICAADALDKARGPPFDLLMSDLDMPVTDGCELLRQLRARYPIHAIAISAHTGEPLAKQAATAGYQCLLTKPLQFDEVVDAISRLPPAP